MQNFDDAEGEVMPVSADCGANAEAVITDQEYWRRVRKLAHDLRSPLSVICTGLQAMEAVRTDEELFNTIRDMMQAAGTELKDLIEGLAPSSGGESKISSN
jgi:hypothetical protein